MNQDQKLQMALAIVEKYGMKGDVIYREIEALSDTETEPKKCEECHGTGRVEEAHKVDNSGRTVEAFGCCDSCEGTGEVLTAQQAAPSKGPVELISRAIQTLRSGPMSGKERHTVADWLDVALASTQREQPAASKQESDVVCGGPQCDGDCCEKVGSKPEPQAQAGGYTAIERLIKWHTAMADEPNRNEAKRLKHRETAITLQAMREAIAKKDAALKACVEAASNAIGCLQAAETEGLHEALAESTDWRLKDLVQRRLMFAFEPLDAAITQAKEALK